MGTTNLGSGLLDGSGIDHRAVSARPRAAAPAGSATPWVLLVFALAAGGYFSYDFMGRAQIARAAADRAEAELKLTRQRAFDAEQKQAALTGQLAAARAENDRLADTAPAAAPAAEPASPAAAPDALAGELGKALVGDEGEVSAAPGKLSLDLTDKALFHGNKAELSSGGKKVLRRIAEVLNKHPERTLAIVAHTEGAPAAGWELSTARALVVARYLVDDARLDAKRLVSAGLGAPRPAARSRSRSRHVELVVASPAPR